MAPKAKQAATKSAAKPVPAKPGAKPGALPVKPGSGGYPKAGAVKSAPAKKPLDYETAKKLVQSTEMKIDDLEQEIQNCADRNEKKTLQANLKKLQDDERVAEARKLVEETAESKRRASLMESKKDNSSVANVVKVDQKVQSGVTVEIAEVEKNATEGSATAAFYDIAKAKGDDAKILAGRRFGAQIRGLGISSLQAHGFMDLIDKLLKGKDKEDKVAAWAAVAGVAWATPFVEPLFPSAVGGTDTISLMAASSMLEQAHPHGISRRLVPMLIEAHKDKKWKTQLRAIQITSVAWESLSKSASVARLAPELLPTLIAALQNIRSEVKEAAKESVRAIINSVYNPEIRSMSSLILPALEDPSKQELTWTALGKMSNTTFMNYIDAGSLAFLVPVLQRALKERQRESKMKGARILGSLVILVFNRATLIPYIPTLIPGLKEAVIDTSPEVQTEAGNVIGNMAKYLTDIYDAQLGPWLFQTLQSPDINERQGAARGLAQAHNMIGEPRLTELIDRATATAGDQNASAAVRSGAVELLDSLGDALKDDYAKHVPKVLQAILPGTADKEEVISEPANRAAKSLVEWFSDSKPRVLILGLETGLVNESDTVRVNTVMLARKAVERIMGRKKDFIKMDCAVPPETRISFMSAMYLCKFDESNDVRRNVSGFFQGACESMKLTFGTIKTKLIEKLNEYAHGSATQKMLASRALEELSAAEDWNETDNPSPTNGVEPPAAAKIDPSQTLQAFDTTMKEIDIRGLTGEEQSLSERAQNGVTSSLGVSPEALGVPQEVLDFIGFVAVDVAMRCGASREKIEHALGGPLAYFLDEDKLRRLVDGICNATGARRERLGTDAGESSLCCVDNLFLCYGGGKLLLRDTTLELIKDHRYGVVGRNGCGKTTLMNQMSGGGLAGMPPELKCVHVKHDILQEIQELTPLEFGRREAPTVKDEELHHWLNDVGFPDQLKNTKVAELSGGFCMRLILAVGLMQGPDVLLLDEPTNHLDEDSMNWLADYLLSMKQSSLMVVSHEPAFLDKICTDIIQYRELKMVYYKGNFTSFREQAGISDADCADILDGGEMAEKGSNKGDDEDEDILVGYGTGAKSKITFPPPMKLVGVSMSKPILEIKSLSFGFAEDAPLILKDVNVKVTQASRIALVGKNGSGKSTLLALAAGELNPTSGELNRHRNLRIAYIPQNQLFYLSDFNALTPQAYIQARYKDGYDELVQTRLLEAKSEEEVLRRKELAKKHGKQGCAVRTIVGRTVKGKDVLYEVAWEGLLDEKQNTNETIAKLRQLGVEGQARAFDERNSVLSNAQEIRPVMRREIVKHFELFGLDEDMVCNRQIGGFSAGQKSKLMLASSLWTRPQAILLDEPTNYVDVETLDAISKALKTFRGGVVISSRDHGFLDKICSDTWLVEDGGVNCMRRETYNTE